MKRSICLAAAFLILFSPYSLAEVRVVRQVVDGDTIILDRGEKVRLIGVDAPEMNDEQRNLKNAVRFGCDRRTVGRYSRMAKQYLTQAVEGQRVRVEYDREKKDRYGRTLAYVYRESDDIFLNAEMIREGYGWAYLRFPFRHAAQFKVCQDQAQARRAGLWSKDSKAKN